MAEGMTTVAETTIAEKLDKNISLTERLLVKLFGDIDGEHPTGRLPLIETRQADHEKRLRAVESWIMKILGGLAALGGMAGCLALLQQLTKH